VRDLVVALGLVLVIEGAIYALIPERAQIFMKTAAGLAPGILRRGGIAAVAVGFVVVWLARGG
jgi:uncharacterized protein YjeT (DUF2065 family)